MQLLNYFHFSGESSQELLQIYETDVTPPKRARVITQAVSSKKNADIANTAGN